MQRTQWFPGEFKPVRKGLYERQFFAGKDPHFSYWNGKAWGISSFSRAGAFFNRKEASRNQDADWRGLTAKGA